MAGLLTYFILFCLPIHMNSGTAENNIPVNGVSNTIDKKLQLREQFQNFPGRKQNLKNLKVTCVSSTSYSQLCTYNLVLLTSYFQL